MWCRCNAILFASADFNFKKKNLLVLTRCCTCPLLTCFFVAVPRSLLCPRKSCFLVCCSLLSKLHTCFSHITSITFLLLSILSWCSYSFLFANASELEWFLGMLYLDHRFRSIGQRSSSKRQQRRVKLVQPNKGPLVFIIQLCQWNALNADIHKMCTLLLQFCRSNFSYR